MAHVLKQMIRLFFQVAVTIIGLAFRIVFAVVGVVLSALGA